MHKHTKSLLLLIRELQIIANDKKTPKSISSKIYLLINQIH
jgi:hypothetical protein